MAKSVLMTSWLRRGRVLRLSNGDRTFSLIPPLEVKARWIMRLHVVVEGERLDVLAQRYFGDCDLWWTLAEVNNCRSPWDIEPGQKLKIPDRRVVQLEVIQDER